jgi:hypothetical protein
MKTIIPIKTLLLLDFIPQMTVKDEGVIYQCYSREFADNNYVEITNDIAPDGSIKSQGLNIRIDYDDTSINRRADVDHVIAAVRLLKNLYPEDPCDDDTMETPIHDYEIIRGH